MHDKYIDGTFSIPTLDPRLTDVAQVCADCGSLSQETALQLLSLNWTMKESERPRKVSDWFSMFPPGHMDAVDAMCDLIGASYEGQLPSDTPSIDVSNLPLPIPRYNTVHGADEIIRTMSKTLGKQLDVALGRTPREEV